jgi:hypothetical protein
MESVLLASYSLLLTMVNIVCIAVMTLIILRIKEVVSLYSVDGDSIDFVHRDVRCARADRHGTSEPINSNGTRTSSRTCLAQTIVDCWRTRSILSRRHDQVTCTMPLSSVSTNIEKNDCQQTRQSLNYEIQRKRFRLQTFAKEYDLDVYNNDDRCLTTNERREKGRLLVNDLIDMCQENSSTVIDIERLQTAAVRTLANNETKIFYDDIIENLPQHWYRLYIDEQQRRGLTPRTCLSSQSNIDAKDNERKLTVIDQTNSPSECCLPDTTCSDEKTVASNGNTHSRSILSSDEQ